MISESGVVAEEAIDSAVAVVADNGREVKESLMLGGRSSREVEFAVEGRDEVDREVSLEMMLDIGSTGIRMILVGQNEEDEVRG